MSTISVGNRLRLGRTFVAIYIAFITIIWSDTCYSSVLVGTTGKFRATSAASASSFISKSMSTPGKRPIGSTRNTATSGELSMETGNKRARGSSFAVLGVRKSTAADNQEKEEIEEQESQMKQAVQNGIALGDTLIRISCRLNDRLKGRIFRGSTKQPVSCSYNVLEYASKTNEMYTRRYGGRSAGRVLLVGMNPGPWGMVQTGVPFGEISYVRDWLKVEGEVGRPGKEHPKRPVEGFDCKRSEVSGQRLWGFFKRRFGTADAWGDKMFAYNYCPLTFMTSSGSNITPDKLPPKEREVIEGACGEALAAMISAMNPCVIVGVGTFAGARCSEALKALRLAGESNKDETEVVIVNHPSPASPTGIKWAKATCMDELVLASSQSREVDRFLA